MLTNAHVYTYIAKHAHYLHAIYYTNVIYLSYACDISHIYDCNLYIMNYHTHRE